MGRGKGEGKVKGGGGGVRRERVRGEKLLSQVLLQCKGHIVNLS